MITIATIPEATIDKVRTSVNIADYIGQYVQLHKAGQNLFGICPFHDERTPSFSVNESKQIFKCFSCGRGGNVFSFVMDYDKLSFPEAVKKVADYAQIPLGVSIDAPTAHEDPAVTAQKELLRSVTDLCHHILLNTTSGEAALAYLTKRGLTQETIDHFDIGYVPAERTILKTFLTNQGVDYQTMRASGLFTENDSGELFDRFNDRVMFPLKDVHGNVIGFSGRVLTKGEQQAKYLNSPETKLFTKSDVLFNLDAAQREFKAAGGALLFEGFMDVIAAYQAGVPTGIASMGTSLTADQVGIISHYTRQVTVCYDGDAPGQKATSRALTLLAAHPQLQVNVVVLPDELDPDEFIKAKGAEAFQRQVQTKLTPVAFQLHALAVERDLTNDQDKLDYINAALQTIGPVQEPAAQAMYLQQLSDLVNVPVAALQRSMAKTPVRSAADPSLVAPPADGGQNTAPQVKFDRFERAERELLYLAWHTPDLARRMHEQQIRFGHDQYQQLFDAWVDYASQHTDPTVAGLLDQLPPEYLTLASDIAMQAPPVESDEGIEDMLRLLGTGQTRANLATVKQQLRQAQQLGDRDQVTRLTNDYLTLLRQQKDAGSAAQAE